MNAKSVEEIAVVLRGMRDAADRASGYRPLVVDLVRELSLGTPVTPELCWSCTRSCLWRPGRR
jgi:hypothetical protein